uniref:Uncharacterized protein n=1 Tax=Cacopsylla melanoneura TaxID=428564 RepID=A0A8D8SL95_9HEMI
MKFIPVVLGTKYCLFCIFILNTFQSICFLFYINLIVLQILFSKYFVDNSNTFTKHFEHLCYLATLLFRAMTINNINKLGRSVICNFVIYLCILCTYLPT